MEKDRRSLKISTFINISIILVFILSMMVIVVMVRTHERKEALRTAEGIAHIILDRNLAIHTYFSHQLKPAVFTLKGKKGGPDYFDPTWMSSTFAVREINKISKNDYYYKECAINARSPENEADGFERTFIKRLNKEPDLRSFSRVRTIEGKQYFTVLQRGEVMEESCLMCHSTPVNAPQELVTRYGPERSFNRSVNEVVSAISIRIPLDSAYADADKATFNISLILFFVLVVMLVVVMAVTNRFIFRPLEVVKEKAVQISASEEHLGEQIPAPPGKELEDLSNAFNRMSTTLRKDRDSLEQKVQDRTAELTRMNKELKDALEQVKTLSGLLPICASCKKVRDDKGYWQQIEQFISDHSDARFTHGICPQCAEKLYPEHYHGEEKE